MHNYKGMLRFLNIASIAIEEKVNFYGLIHIKERGNAFKLIERILNYCGILTIGMKILLRIFSVTLPIYRA